MISAVRVFRAKVGGMITLCSALRRGVVALVTAALLVLAVPPGGSGAVASGAPPAERRGWPVGAPRAAVLRGWDPPDSPYGPGHRGVDLAAGAGTEVRAAAAGRVLFAGRVAGRGVLSIVLSGTGDPPLRTTYEPVDPLVARGDEVVAGQVVARLTAGRSHCLSSCLHWGLRRADTYLNPLALLPSDQLHRPRSRLLPLSGITTRPPGGRG